MHTEYLFFIIISLYCDTFTMYAYRSLKYNWYVLHRAVITSFKHTFVDMKYILNVVLLRASFGQRHCILNNNMYNKCYMLNRKMCLNPPRKFKMVCAYNCLARAIKWWFQYCADFLFRCRLKWIINQYELTLSIRK